MELLEKQKRGRKRDAATSRIQRAWSRHRAAIFDRQQRETKETPPPLPPPSSVIPDGSNTEKLSVSATKGEVTQEYTPSPPREHPNSSREDWSALSPLRTAAKVWEELGVTADATAFTDGDRLGNTSNKVEEESAPSQQNTTGRLPSSGMMTVRVRRGSEETSLVTPIVLTESGIAASEAAADGDVHPGLDNAQTNGAHQPWAVQTGSPNAAKTSVPYNGSKHSIKLFYANGDAKAVDARSPSARLAKESHGRNSAVQIVTPAPPTAEATVRCGRKHQVGDAWSKALVPMAAGTHKNEEKTPRPWSALAATTYTTPTAGGEGDMVAAATSGTVLDEKQPATEQFFMEDSQVYLGCATCGMKYLVEAVDPHLSESAQGDFKTMVSARN